MTTPNLAVAAPPREKVAPVVPIQAKLFPLEDVRVLGGPFQAAQETDRAYLLKLDPDRLLADLRKNAGLAPKAAHYGGWDVGGSGTVGHYLSACALMAQSTGDPELKRRVSYIVAEMAACQAAGDGGLYAYSWDKDNYFPSLAAGKVIPVNTSAWYVTHKIMAGLRDAYLVCGDEQASDVLVKLTDWADRVTSKLTDAQWQEMLGPPDKMGEFGGPHEVIADVYAITGDRKYLTLAEKFRHDLVFDPMVHGEGGVLDGRHANAEIPKFVGYERIYELTGDPVWGKAAGGFWRNVVSERTWANGGDGQWEHFFNPDQGGEKSEEICGPETCATYNMLKLTRQLYTLRPSVRDIDFYERGLYNSILPSQAPGGGFVYYTSLRPGNYRVYSRPYDAFWCCVGTGMENHGKYGELIYAHTNDRLFVNLFIPSSLAWKAQGMTLRQETKFPEESHTRLALTLAQPRRMTVSVRYPGWAAPGALKIQVNGQPINVAAKPGSYIDITRLWKSGDRIEVLLPMHLTTETLAHSPSHAAFFYGPVLLAGALGTEGLTRDDFYGGGDNTNINNQLAKKTLPVSRFPALSGTPTEALARIHPVPGHPLEFKTSALGAPNGVTLLPFYDIYFQRYAVYWPLTTAVSYEKEQQEVKEAAARVVDRVLVGETASETEHHLAAERSSTGAASLPYTHWRDAAGWFSYDLKVLPDRPMSLKCSYWGSDAGRVFDVIVDGRVIATQQLTGSKPNAYLDVVYPIPLDITQSRDHVMVRFAPKVGSAGGLFDLQMLRGE